MEEDLEKTQILDHSLETPITEPSEAAAAKTAKLPRLDSGAFRIETEGRRKNFASGRVAFCKTRRECAAWGRFSNGSCC